MIFWLGTVAYACLHLASKKLRCYIIRMHRFSFLARMCFVAWNDNMEVVSDCCYVSLAANSPCIPGLKVQNTFLFLKNKILWKETTGMLFFKESFNVSAFHLFPEM